MLEKFASRKFVAAGAAFLALILATTGVIDQGEEIQVAEALTVVLYIAVQGFIDARN